jgi:hypothetical protein
VGSGSGRRTTTRGAAATAASTVRRRARACVSARATLTSSAQRPLPKVVDGRWLDYCRSLASRRSSSR